MALPITIFTSSNAFKPPLGGPFKSGTSFYVVYLDIAPSNDELHVKKADSDDPSSGWTAQDTSNAPSLSTDNDLSSIHAILAGTTLHIVTQEASGAGFDVEYHTFNCSTNLWSITNESVTTTPDTLGFCSISVRSDGDVVIAYQGAAQGNMGTDYDRVDLARRESGTWTADISIDNLGKTTTHMRYPFVVMSANDRAHIFYHDVTANDLHYSTYLSGNTWGHQHTECDANTGSATSTWAVNAVSFDDGGTSKVRAVYRDSATNSATVVGFDDADSPGTSITISTDLTGAEASATPKIAVDDSTDTQYLLSHDGSGNIDEYETGSGDDTWTSNVNELTSLTSPIVYSANVYDNGGTVLAYLYLDGSNYRYNERSLGSTPTPQTLNSSGVGTATLTTEKTAFETLASSGVAAATIALVLTLSKVLTSTVTGSATLVKKLFETLVSSGIGTATLAAVLLFVKALNSTAIGAATLSTIKTAYEVLTSSGVVSALLTPAAVILKVLGSTGIAATSIARTTSKIISTTVITAASLLTDLTHVLALTATSVVAAILTPIGLVLKNLTATVTGSGVLTPAITFVRSLPASGVVAPSISRVLDYFRTLSSAATGTPALTTIAEYLRTLTSSAVGTATFVVVNFFSRLLSSVGVGTPSLSFAPTFTKILAASVSVVASFIREISMTLTFSPFGNGSLSSNSTTAKLLSVAATGTASIADAFVFLKTLVATTVVSPALNFTKEFLQVLSALGNAAATLTPSMIIAQVLTATTNVAVSFARTTSKTLAAIPVAAASLLANKTLQKVLSASVVAAPLLTPAKIFLKVLSSAGTAAASLVTMFLPGSPPVAASVKRVIWITLNKWR